MPDIDPKHFRRELKAGQSCVVAIYDVDMGASEDIYRTRQLLLEAPNWTADNALILNGDLMLWRLSLADRSLQTIAAPDLLPVNNDHVLAGPDGPLIYVSAIDFHIHCLNMASGEHSRVTRDDPDRPLLRFLHGVSPDGGSLAYVGVSPGETHFWGALNIYTEALATGEVRQLTFGERPADGPEYSPGGQWIYFNSEQFSAAEGHAQIARIRPDGTGLQQLTFDERVNWFPHLAPRGDLACYLSYPPGTTGHPADSHVELRLVHGEAWDDARTVVVLPGGQGTINVNSWSPCGRRFAYVYYPSD